MIPKKASSLYKEITKEFEVSEDLVETIVENYYKTLRRNVNRIPCGFDRRNSNS